ncbi:MAG: hypothetical protein K8S16_21435, partial [Bacteroidales bacterium]|nr:hypothetical protein [Bacteroidales bacterium]
MRNKNLLLLMFALAISGFVMGQKGSASATYTAADIPTTYGTSHSPTCSGAAHPLTVTMPAGDYTITSVDVVYDMTSVSAWMSEQRSRLACATTGTNEGTDYAGVGSSGTYSYNRPGLTFANGDYSGNLIFENWAFRRYYSPTGCSPSTVKVDNSTWTVTVNYTVAATCPDPTAQTESTIEANSAVLGWTENGSATSWDIELGTYGFSPTGIPTQSGVTNTYTYEDLTRNTHYDWYVRANCGGGDYSNWVGPSDFTTTVCDVFLNNDFETGDFTSWTTAGTAPCHSSSVVSYGGSGSGSWSGYIDIGYGTAYASGSPYDPSNTFWETVSQSISICDEAKSLCFDMASSGSSWNDCGQVWIKDNVGTYTRLFRAARSDPWAARAVNIETWAGETVTIYFCGYNGNGYSDHQADIYFDNVTLSETGVPPTTLTETYITASGADLGWTNNNTYFDLYIVTSGSPAPTAGSTPTINNTTDNPYTWSGGNHSTAYDWYVRVDYAAAGGSGQGPWSESSTFTTPYPPITTFPALENFESFTVAVNATGYQNGWTTSPTGTTSSFRWNVDTYRTPSSNTGPQNDHTLGTSSGKFLYAESSNAGTYAYVYSPGYDLTGLTNTTIKFWYHMYGGTMGELHLDISADGGANWTNDITTALIGQQHTSMTDPWSSRTVDISAYNGETVYFRFRGKRGTSYTGDMAIDDFSVFDNLESAITWNGTVDTDWNNGSNWGGGSIPDFNDDVTIPTSPTGGNFPETNTGAGASCFYLTIQSGAHLYIPSDNTLTVNGTLTNSAGVTGLVIKSTSGSLTGSLIHSTSGVNATVERYTITDG